MYRRHSLLAGTAAYLGMTLVVAALAGCSTGSRMATPIQATVSIGADGLPEVRPEPVTAHEGDVVRWVFQGGAAKEFAVDFTDVAKSPFDWSYQRGSTVTGTVKAGAAKNGQATDYKYGVDVAGKKRDPIIIIQK